MNIKKHTKKTLISIIFSILKMLKNSIVGLFIILFNIVLILLYSKNISEYRNIRMNEHFSVHNCASKIDNILLYGPDDFNYNDISEDKTSESSTTNNISEDHKFYALYKSYGEVTKMYKVNNIWIGFSNNEMRKKSGYFIIGEGINFVFLDEYDFHERIKSLQIKNNIKNQIINNEIQFKSPEYYFTRYGRRDKECYYTRFSYY